MTRPGLLQQCLYSERDEDVLAANFRLFRIFEATDQDAFLADNARNIRAIAGRGDLVVDRKLISVLPNLEIVSVFGAGYDGVDVDAASEAGVIVTNTPDVLSGDVADLAVGLYLAVMRDLVTADAYVRQGIWKERGPYRLFNRVGGRTAGIVGLGRIGREIAGRLAALGMNILYWSRTDKAAADWTRVEGRHELAARSDVLFVALAANRDTFHFVDRGMIEAVGPEGVIVNISRGSTIDEQVLLDSLENRRLGAAGLDVFADEPDVNRRFCHLDNVVLHPHHGSGTIESRREMGELVTGNLIAHFRGKLPLTPVNADRVGKSKTTGS